MFCIFLRKQTLTNHFSITKRYRRQSVDCACAPFDRFRPNVGQPTFCLCVTGLVLRVTSRRQLVECLHLASGAFVTDCLVLVWFGSARLQANRLDDRSRAADRTRTGGLLRSEPDICSASGRKVRCLCSVRPHSASWIFV